MMRFALSLALLVALGACGSRTQLQPAPGHQLPVAPYGADRAPDADALLEPTDQAAPERSVEKRKRSEERRPDPFDFPPAGN